MRKKYIIILVLAFIAFLNAAYLSTKAYRLLNPVAGVIVTSACDISPSFSCTNVIVHPDTMILGIPFPYLALIVYPIIILLTIWGIMRTRKACKSEDDAKQASESKGIYNMANDWDKEAKWQSQTKLFHALPAKIINWVALGGIIFNGYIISQEVLYIHAYCLLCLLCAAIIVAIFGITWTMRKS